MNLLADEAVECRPRDTHYWSTWLEFNQNRSERNSEYS